MTGQLTLDAPAATAAPRNTPAQDICAGDFTYITGFREVQRVVRRPRKRTVRVFWRNGAQTFRYDTILKVRKP